MNQTNTPPARMDRLVGDHARNDFVENQERAVTKLSCKTLVDASTLRQADFACLVAKTHEFPRADLARLRGGVSLAGEFSPVFLREASLYPHRPQDNSLRLAFADPSMQDAIEAVRLTLRCLVA